MYLKRIGDCLFKSLSGFTSYCGRNIETKNKNMYTPLVHNIIIINLYCVLYIFIKDLFIASRKCSYTIS